MACDRGKPIWTNIFERRIKSSKIPDFVDFLRHFEVGKAFFFEACSGFLWTLHILWVVWRRQVFNIRPIKALSWIWRVYDDMNHIQCVIKVFACWLCDMNMQLYIDALWTISSIDFKFISETVSIESSRSIIHIELKALYSRPSCNVEGRCLHLVLVIFMSSYVHIYFEIFSIPCIHIVCKQLPVFQWRERPSFVPWRIQRWRPPLWKIYFPGCWIRLIPIYIRIYTTMD